jgi:hypothetical protein
VLNGRGVQLRCAGCGRTREVSREMPKEYTACFSRSLRICLRKQEGLETVDDEEKIKKK